MSADPTPEEAIGDLILALQAALRVGALSRDEAGLAAELLQDLEDPE